jgi:hypothetical protein
MWDEGETEGGVNGHYDSMKNDQLNHVSCGFAWTSDGSVMMNQVSIRLLIVVLFYTSGCCRLGLYRQAFCHTARACYIQRNGCHMLDYISPCILSP